MPTFVARSGSFKDLKVSSSLLVSGSVDFTTLTTPPTTVSDVLIISSSGRVFITASTALGGGGTPPGGVEYSVQFNSASVLEGDDNFLYQYESRSLSLGSSGGGAPPVVNAINSIAVGYNLNISGSDSSVAFGQNNNVSGNSALAMGDNNIITIDGDGGFVGGGYSLVSGNRSIAFGYNSTASGTQTAAFNLSAHASGNYSFAANAGTVAKGEASTALGQNTVASGAAQTVVGQYNTQGNTTDLFTVGNGAGIGSRADAFGVSSTRTFASGNVFLPGLTTTNQSNVVTINTTTGQLYYTASSAFGGGGSTNPGGVEYSVQFNSASTFEGDASFLFQYESKSLAQGINTTAAGLYSHAEGQLTFASGASSHAEGYSTTALGVYAHSEGNVTTASGVYSHAEGSVTNAIGTASHAEGSETTAFGNFSHASGVGTIASGSAQTAIGYYNKQNNTTDVFVIGKGANAGTRADMLGVSTTRMFSSGAIYFPELTTTNQSNVVTINTATGQLYYTASSAFGGGSGVTINNNFDNYILTATGTANTINGESNFRFNGSILSVTGSLNSSGSVFFPMLTTTNQSNVVTINTTTGQLYYTASSAFGGGGGGGGGTLKDLQVNATSYSNSVVLKFSGSNYSGSDDGAGTTTIFYKPNNGSGGSPGRVQYAGNSDNFTGHTNFTYDDGVRSLTVPGLSVATATDNIDNRFCAIEIKTDLNMATGYETGKVFMIKNTGGGSSYSVNAPSGGTIDNNSSITLANEASVILVHFGSEDYKIMSSYLYP
jgi:hypothetical protein